MGQLGRCSVFFGELLFEIGILVERLRNFALFPD